MHQRRLIKGAPHEAGSVVEVTEKIGLQLINMGKAQPHDDDAAEEKGSRCRSDHEKRCTIVEARSEEESKINGGRERGRQGDIPRC